MMNRLEFLKLFDDAKKVVDAVKSGDVSVKALRSKRALKQMARASPSLALNVIRNTSIGTRLEVLSEHPNPEIKSSASSLRDIWLKTLYHGGTGTHNHKVVRVKLESKPKAVYCVPCQQRNTTGSVKSQLRKRRDKPTGKSPIPNFAGHLKSSATKNEDSTRGKVREILEKAMSRVFSETTGETKDKVLAYDPCATAISMESAIFRELGSFGGAKKAKYRSILFNMSDPRNPDLRRNVLLGEIKPQTLIVMRIEELGGEKRQGREPQRGRRRVSAGSLTCRAKTLSDVTC